MNKETTRETALDENSLNFIQAPEGTLVIQIKGNWKIGNRDSRNKKTNDGSRF